MTDILVLEEELTKTRLPKKLPLAQTSQPVPWRYTGNGCQSFIESIPYKIPEDMKNFGGSSAHEHQDITPRRYAANRMLANSYGSRPATRSVLRKASESGRIYAIRQEQIAQTSESYVA